MVVQGDGGAIKGSNCNGDRGPAGGNDCPISCCNLLAVAMVLEVVVVEVVMIALLVVIMMHVHSEKWCWWWRNVKL